MGFFASIFSPSPVSQQGLSESESFWKDRALSLEEEIKELREKHEKELKDERTRNRKREDLLQDRILVSKGLPPIAKQADKELGFNFNQTEKPLTEAERNELKYYVENAVKHNKSAAEAEKYWMENVRK